MFCKFCNPKAFPYLKVQPNLRRFARKDSYCFPYLQEKNGKMLNLGEKKAEA